MRADGPESVPDGAPDPGPFAFLSRRRFLKVALGAGVVVAGGGAGLVALRGTAPDVAGLGVLSAHEYRTLTLLAHALLPRGGAFEHGAEDLDLAREFDAFLAGEPEANVTDLKRGLLLLEYGPLLFEGRLTTFSRLDAGARLAHWEGWAASGLLLRRQVSLAFRRFLTLVFYDHPAAWAGIGYPGPSFAGGGQ
jgi:hypothetical protein